MSSDPAPPNSNRKQDRLKPLLKYIVPYLPNDAEEFTDPTPVHGISTENSRLAPLQPVAATLASTTDHSHLSVAQGEHDDLNIGYIPHLTIYILDLTLECIKSTEDSHGEDGVSAMETNSGGVTMSGKLIPHLLYFMDVNVSGHMPDYTAPINAQKKVLNHMISEQGLSETPTTQTAEIVDGQTVDISARLTYRHYLTGKNHHHSRRSCF